MRRFTYTRKENDKNASMNHKQAMSLDDLFASIQEGNKEIKVIIKADVNGSAEAVKNSLEKLDVEGVKVTVIRSTVGAITESDIVLANASNLLYHHHTFSYIFHIFLCYNHILLQYYLLLLSYTSSFF